jgi:hypothetical protein
MSFRLPEALRKLDGAFYTGARYDDWDSVGTRPVHTDRFTADDRLLGR